MKQPVIILGGGGHAKVLIESLQTQGVEIIGFTDPDQKIATDIQGVKRIGDDEAIFDYSPEEVLLVNGIGSVQSTNKRKELYVTFKLKGYSFASVIHSSTIIASHVSVAEGVQIMAGTIIQPGCKLGSNTLINTKSSIDHDCMIGAHVHVAPGVIFSGNVKVDDCVHIGTGAVILQDINIGSNSLIGAASLVNENVKSDSKVYGVPAREVF